VQVALEVAPSVAEAVPDEQAWQVALDVAPVAVEYVPAAHFVHSELPVPEAYVPAGHVVQLVAAPPAEYVPASQVLQMPLSRYCPAEQLFCVTRHCSNPPSGVPTPVYPLAQAVHFDPVQLLQFETPVAEAHVTHVPLDRVCPAAQAVQALFAQAVQFGNAVAQAEQTLFCST
jgi:hypothetical protein